MRPTLAQALVISCAILLAHGASLSLRHGALQAESDEVGAAAPKPLSPAEKRFILDRLKARKEAIKRLALEDALGDENREQAKAESDVLTTMGSGAFIGADEQKAKLTAYAADAADALERARKIKEDAEEASSQAASVAVLAVARAPDPDPHREEREKRSAVLAATRPEDRPTVSAILGAVDAGERAEERHIAETASQAAAAERKRLSEQAMQEAEAAARQGPQAVQLLAMRQMFADLERVRRLGQPERRAGSKAEAAEEAGRERVVGGVEGSLADSMGWSRPLQG